MVNEKMTSEQKQMIERIGQENKLKEKFQQELSQFIEEFNKRENANVRPVLMQGITYVVEVNQSPIIKK